MLVNAQNTSKTSTSRKQTQMSLLDQISVLFLLIAIGLVPSRPHKVNLELMILDHRILSNLGWHQSRLHHHTGGSS